MKNLPRVLIVEDEPAIAELISVNLRHNGLQPVWAEDGAAAQRELDAVLPDVILLDWMLPGQSGLQLARKWRARCAHQGHSRSSCSRRAATSPTRWPGWTPAPTTTSPSRSRPRNCWPASAPCCGGGRPSR